MEQLIGLTKDEASEYAKINGYHVRVMKEDGINYVGTDDIDVSRINLEIENGIIIKTSIG